MLNRKREVERVDATAIGPQASEPPRYESGGFSFARVRWPHRTVDHQYPEDGSLHVVTTLSGGTRLRYSDGRRSIDRMAEMGSSSLLLCRHPFSITAVGAPDLVHFHLASWLVDELKLNGSLFAISTPDKQLESLSYAAAASIGSGQANDALFRSSLETSLLKNLSSPLSEPKRGGLSRRSLNRVQELIAFHLAQPGMPSPTLSSLAAAADLSPFHFSREFKAAMGVSPHKYFLRRRLEAARDLLVTTDLPLLKIATDTGFVSLSHLCLSFRQELYLTPGRFRALIGSRRRQGSPDAQSRDVRDFSLTGYR